MAIVEEAQREAPTESETALVVPDPAVREDQSALALVSFDLADTIITVRRLIRRA
ncbi:hypothetical protein [Streptomyces atratus]|uniref:hypothetical protein n=1 Tax=Streptomyces atratus TaxID=1893 RepID=UPI0033E13B19